MQTGSGIEEDRASAKSVQGSYEWWYFDALDHDERYAVTVIFYEGNPFSSRYAAYPSVKSGSVGAASEYPAVSITVYDRNETIYYGFVETTPDRASFSRTDAKGRCDDNSFSGTAETGEIHYTVEIDQKLPGGDSVAGTLYFQSRNRQASLPQNETTDPDPNHRWALVQPDAKVDGTIRIDGLAPRKIHFTGKGYHDHNTGLEPMVKSFSEWYWGRFHFGGRTLIYYLMERHDSSDRCAWLIHEDDRVEPLDTTVRLEDRSINLFGLRSFRRISLEGEKSACHIQHVSIPDNGPFYQRFLSQGVLHSDGSLSQITGIGEYLVPERISWRLFRPLFFLRIVYPARPAHWVQKRPRLYRYTW